MDNLTNAKKFLVDNKKIFNEGEIKSEIITNDRLIDTIVADGGIYEYFSFYGPRCYFVAKNNNELIKEIDYSEEWQDYCIKKAIGKDKSELIESFVELLNKELKETTSSCVKHFLQDLLENKVRKDRLDVEKIKSKIQRILELEGKLFCFQFDLFNIDGDNEKLSQLKEDQDIKKQEYLNWWHIQQNSVKQGLDECDLTKFEFKERDELKEIEREMENILKDIDFSFRYNSELKGTV